MSRLLNILLVVLISFPALAQSQSFKDLYSSKLSSFTYMQGQCEILSGEKGIVIAFDENNNGRYREHIGLWTESDLGVNRDREECQIIHGPSAIIYYSSVDQYTLVLGLDNDEFDEFWSQIPSSWREEIGPNRLFGIGKHRHYNSNQGINFFTGAK